MLPQPFLNPVVAVAPHHQTGAGTMIRMSMRGHDVASNMPIGYANLLENIKVHTVKIRFVMGNKYDSLVEEINKQEEIKEQKSNLDNELQLLKQAISDLHDNVEKLRKRPKMERIW